MWGDGCATGGQLAQPQVQPPRSDPRCAVHGTLPATLATRCLRASAHSGLMAAQRKGRGCGWSCRMRKQLHTRVHHSRTVPSALALAIRAAFSTAEASDFRCQLTMSSDRPLHSCSARLVRRVAHPCAP